MSNALASKVKSSTPHKIPTKGDKIQQIRLTNKLEIAAVFALSTAHYLLIIFTFIEA
jgi:ribosomal protein S30